MMDVACDQDVSGSVRAAAKGCPAGEPEQGYVLVFVALGLLVLFTVSTLAIDVGMLLTARNEAQNAADAGALSGAIALVFDDYTDRSPGGAAVQSALAAARANSVMGQQASAEVTFVADPQGMPNWIRVSVFRTAGRGNPVSNLVAWSIGVPTSDITATATAGAAPANGAPCVLPLAIPDKWIERETPPWDPTDTFSAFPKKSTAAQLPVECATPPDLYYPANQSNYTGYSLAADVGLQLTLTITNGKEIEANGVMGLALAGSRGASDYRQNIAGCNPSVMHVFDLMTAEPGSMTGPTRQGFEDLIAQDPGAHWDSSTRRVVSSQHPSPRVRLLPVFDPYYLDSGKQHGRNADLKAANFIGVFVEGLQGHNVVVRIVPVTGLLSDTNPSPAGAFPRAIRLMQ